MSESTQDRPDEADENAQKPGEQDTETVAGQPKKAPESTDAEQSKQDRGARHRGRRACTRISQAASSPAATS